MNAPGSGFEFPTKEVSWNSRDSLLFAISIGIDIDELNFVFEHDPQFHAFPTYANILPLKGTSQDVIDFNSTISAIKIPGVPELRPERVVDAHRAMTFYHPLPATSKGKKFEISQKVIGVYDKGPVGTVLELETLLKESDTDNIYTRMVGSTFFVGQGNWGGPKGPSPVKYDAPTEREPDAVAGYQTNTQSPLLYRLNGDYNALHVIPSLGRKLGFGGPVMHGLFTFNVAAHAILKTIGHSEPQNLKFFSAKFQAPVKPDDVLTTQMWKMGQNQDGLEEVRFLTVTHNNEIVLSNGVALIKTDQKGKL